MQRSTILKSIILIIGLVLVLPAFAFIYDQGTQQISQTIVNVYGGVETVQVTGSVPNEMDRNQFGYFGATFWNPTDSVYQITRVEFNASSATNRVFGGVSQGAGLSYPTSGWTRDGGRKTIYLTTTLNIQPHTAQQFYVRIRGNRITETFQVSIRITANATMFNRPFQTRQVNGNFPFSVLWFGNGPTPQFLASATRGQETTFSISLQEDSGNAAIGINGKLTVQLPTEFTNIQNTGGTGWGTATITDNRIEVNNTIPVRDSYITYRFRVTAPMYEGLYMINASFSGSPNEHPVGSFPVAVIDGP
jgi:hypothetical protein